MNEREHPTLEQSLKLKYLGFPNDTHFWWAYGPDKDRTPFICEVWTLPDDQDPEICAAPTIAEGIRWLGLAELRMENKLKMSTSVYWDYFTNTYRIDGFRFDEQGTRVDREGLWDYLIWLAMHKRIDPRTLEERKN